MSVLTSGSRIVGHERGVMAPRAEYEDGAGGRGKDRDKLWGLRVTFVI